MNPQELARYTDNVTAAHRVPFFVERLFRTDDDWERLAPHEICGVSLTVRLVHFERL